MGGCLAFLPCPRLVVESVVRIVPLSGWERMDSSHGDGLGLCDARERGWSLALDGGNRMGLDGRGNLSLPTFPRFSVLALFLWKVQRPNPLLSIRRQPMAFPRCRNQPSMMRSLNGKIAFFNLEIIRLLGFVNFYIFFCTQFIFSSLGESSL